MPEALVASASSSLLLACVVLIVVLASVHVVDPPPCGAFPLAWYLDERTHTGDIVFFKRRVGWLHRWVSAMTHVALIIMHPVTGEPWLVEMHDADTVEGHGAGVHMYPARDRLGDAEGELFVVPARAPLNATRAMKAARRFVDMRYPRNLHGHIAACKLLRDRRVGRHMVCSEFVQAVLRDLGAIPHNWRCVTPSDLLHLALRSPKYDNLYALE